MSALLDELLDLLDLEQVEVDIFRGRTAPTPLQRIFGGHVAGQALVAAGRSVPADRGVHSLHAYFLRMGDPRVPIVYTVDRIRDGRSFTTRRVVALQHGQAIFALTASFCLPEEGFSHADPMPQAPAPEDLPTMAERLAAYPGPKDQWWQRPRPIDLRYASQTPRFDGDIGPRPPDAQVWLRADGRLPDDPLLHVCLLTYASDMTLLDSTLLPHEASLASGVSGASLDHAMWFHRPFRADEWLLYDQHSPSAAAARGLAHGRIFQNGELVVSVMQEGLIRPTARASSLQLAPRPVG